MSFPPAPEYSIKSVSNFFENSRRYSRVKVHHRYQRHRWQIAEKDAGCGKGKQEEDKRQQGEKEKKDKNKREKRKVRKGMEGKEKGEVKEKDEEKKRLGRKKRQEKTKILQELHGKSGTYPCFSIVPRRLFIPALQ